MGGLEMRLYFRVLLLAVSLLFSAVAYGQEKGYCIQVATVASPELGKKLIEGLDCSQAPMARVEKVNGGYAVRIGFWASPEEARRLLKKLKRGFGDAVVLRCYFKEKRVVFKRCFPEDEKAEEAKEVAPPTPEVVPAEVKEKRPEHLLTLRDLGYPNDMVLKGNSFSHTFYLPVLPQFKKGFFKLKMRISPLVPSEGHLTVFLNGLPYETYRIAEVGYRPEVEVPVVPDQLSYFSKVRVEFNFLPKAGICEALSVKGSYAIFDDASLFKVYPKEGFRPSDVLSYLIDYDGRLYPQGEDLLSMAKFSYYLAALYKRFSLYNLRFTPDAPKKVLLSDGPSRLKGDSLLLNPDDLASGRFVWPLKSPEFSSETSPPEFLPGELVPLKAVGFTTTTVEGVGSTSVSFDLPFQFLKGKPKKLMLFLRYSVQRVGIGSGDRLWISLLANGNLVWSRELIGVSEVQENLVEVPDYALKFGKNSFSVVFSYYPGMGTCNGSVPQLKFTLYDTSAFSYAGLNRDFASVTDFLSSISGRVAVDAQGVSKDFVLNLFKLLGYSSPDGKITSKGGDFAIVVRPFSDLKGEGYPVRYDERFIRIYNPLTGKTVLKVSGNYDFVLFQIGSYNGTPALFVSPSGPEAEKILASFDWSSLSKLTGNAAFLFKESLYTFSIGKKFRVEYGTRAKVEYYLKKYKFALVVLLLVVITLFTLYLWRRLT